MEQASRPLEGEDIETTDWEEARHWISIYGDLLEFKRGLLERIRSDLTRLPTVARRAAEVDLRIIEDQMEGYRKRFELWNRRIRDLDGLALEQEGRLIRYHGREATLTVREFQLLQLLLDHPYQYFTVTQILSAAWADPAILPEEVRNYVQRVRKVMAALKTPCDVVNRIGRGYSLEFRADR